MALFYYFAEEDKRIDDGDTSSDRNLSTCSEKHEEKCTTDSKKGKDIIYAYAQCTNWYVFKSRPNERKTRLLTFFPLYPRFEPFVSFVRPRSVRDLNACRDGESRRRECWKWSILLRRLQAAAASDFVC